MWVPGELPGMGRFILLTGVLDSGRDGDGGLGAIRQQAMVNYIELLRSDVFSRF